MNCPKCNSKSEESTKFSFGQSWFCKYCIKFYMWIGGELIQSD